MKKIKVMLYGLCALIVASMTTTSLMAGAGDFSGPYIGIVKHVDDPLRMGRLGVNIPALSTTNNPSPSQVIWCQYLSPFYGAKSFRSVSTTDPYSFRQGQTAYGMWAVPPDL